MRIFRTSWVLALAGALATATVSSAAGPTEAATFLKKVAGVYKRPFENSLVTGEKVQSEDILEVVPVDDDHAYIRMHLEFYNGHIAALYGIATYSGHDSLVYDNREAGDERCVLTLSWSRSEVSTAVDYSKTPGCRQYHGVRASLDSTFSVAKRRDIRYLPRLRESRQFKAAMAEFRGEPAAR
jgi:hypothetical protein